MLNPNIEMLENLISAAVSTRYKEVPPTEEEFLTLAQSMRATLSTLPVTDEEFAEILVRLRASIVIQMDVGVYINDRNTPHKSWLPSRRADLDFFFWNRYKKYLEEIKHWNPRAVSYTHLRTAPGKQQFPEASFRAGRDRSIRGDEERRHGGAG